MIQPIETVKIFQKNGEPQSFPAGETIFTEGEPGEVMYGVVEGEVELLVNSKVVETIVKGDVFGEGAIVQPEHLRVSTAMAKTDCQLIPLNQERFLFAVEETPFFALEVIQSLSNRLRKIKHLF